MQSGLCNKREWKFVLEDPIMEENQGNFCLTIDKDGNGKAVKISEKCSDTINIQTMTTMLMGYKRPDYLAKIGRIKADSKIIEMLEDSIGNEIPYVSDYF